MPSDKELIGRAYGAWLKYRGAHRSPPTFGASTVETYDDRVYVFLRRGDQIVDVYRYLAPEDSLKRLARYWPGPYGRQRAAA
jgi:hypothetical protein